jgi:hypothetical protein
MFRCTHPQEGDKAHLFQYPTSNPRHEPETLSGLARSLSRQASTQHSTKSEKTMAPRTLTSLPKWASQKTFLSLRQGRERQTERQRQRRQRDERQRKREKHWNLNFHPEDMVTK